MRVIVRGTVTIFLETHSVNPFETSVRIHFFVLRRIVEIHSS